MNDENKGKTLMEGWKQEYINKYCDQLPEDPTTYNVFCERLWKNWEKDKTVLYRFGIEMLELLGIVKQGIFIKPHYVDHNISFMEKINNLPDRNVMHEIVFDIVTSDPEKEILNSPPPIVNIIPQLPNIFNDKITKLHNILKSPHTKVNTFDNTPYFNIAFGILIKNDNLKDYLYSGNDKSSTYCEGIFSSLKIPPNPAVVNIPFNLFTELFLVKTKYVDRYLEKIAFKLFT